MVEGTAADETRYRLNVPTVQVSHAGLHLGEQHDEGPARRQSDQTEDPFEPVRGHSWIVDRGRLSVDLVSPDYSCRPADRASPVIAAGPGTAATSRCRIWSWTSRWAWICRAS